MIIPCFVNPCKTFHRLRNIFPFEANHSTIRANPPLLYCFARFGNQKQSNDSERHSVMASGKVQTKRIENSINRQVTYSKRRKGLFKKAHEHTVLCDAKVSIIMLSRTGKLHEYISPATSAKELFFLYQITLGVDLWKTHWERMLEQLRKLKDVNRNLRRQIRQRMGDSLDNLGFQVDNSLKVIRERKKKSLSNKIDTGKKKLRSVQEIHRNLLQTLDAIDDPLMD